MTVEDAAKVVLGTNGIEAYKEDLQVYKDLLPAYRYHFLTRSKPGTHLRVLVNVDDQVLRADMPASLRALLKRVKKYLRHD